MMNSAKQWTRAAAVLACAWSLSALNARAQRVFSSSDEAIKALQTAAQAQDKGSLAEIFGPDFDKLQTGDKAEDARHRERFAAAMAQSCKQVPEGDNMIQLEIGTNEWPMPIPLVKVDGQWHFDTEAGKEEIITRHIGQDELEAVGVCRDYVKAQQKYASADSGPNGSYAVKFMSAPGKKDGLCWASGDNDSASLFGPLAAKALSGERGARPFHGYFFRILTRQGEAAPGGKRDYMSQGMLAGGFALVAYPEHWDKSGIMTFIVNQDGKVYEHNFGDRTSRDARRMKEYNPGEGWTLVEEDGIQNAASEK
ncbi:MAG TPA: DUF2950 family protein [Verrucomicrobiae bacterium]|jgi:hypothetical protein